MFQSTEKTNFKLRCFAKLMNFFPTYRRTGGRVIFISDNWVDVHIRLKLGWGTRNYVGTMFGGSMASAADPIFMIQLMRILGDNYIVWDKAASIRFKRPGNQTLYCRFYLPQELLDTIKKRVETEKEFDLELATDWVDKTGKVYATVSKILYIAEKSFYKDKKAKIKI